MAWQVIWPVFKKKIRPISFILYYHYYCLPNVPNVSFPIVEYPNKWIINHKSVILDWQHRASVSCLRQTGLNRVDAQDSRKERKRPEEAVKCNEITYLFRTSGAG